jgi:hypothetical protein
MMQGVKAGGAQRQRGDAALRPGIALADEAEAQLKLSKCWRGGDGLHAAGVEN